MDNSPNIRISKYAAFTYTARILLAPEPEMTGKRKNEIDLVIKNIFKDAVYISDNFGEIKDEDKAAVLLRNNNIKIDFLVRNRTIITLWPVGKDRNKRINREKAARNETRRTNSTIS